MGKDRKLKFRGRYLLIIILLLLFYQGWKFFIPVKGYEFKWLTPVTDKRIAEVENLIPDAFSGSLKSVETSILEFDWVRDVRFDKSITGIMVVSIEPRIAVARIGIKGITEIKEFGVDGWGVIFEAEGIDTLPVIEVQGDSLERDLREAVRILESVESLAIEKVLVTEFGCRTRIGDLKIIWGRDGYPEKERLLKRILKEKIVSRGTLDFRFKNQVIVRR